MKTKLAALTATTAMLLTISAVPASAEHRHVRETPAGCVLLAKKGGETNVVLPGYENLPENRRHPHHVKVHIGKAGKGKVFVKGSAEDIARCGGVYRNG